MVEADYDEFTEILDAVSTMLSRGRYVPDEKSTAIWWRTLAPYALPVVRAAFDAHVNDPDRGRFVPVPADILARIVGAAVDDQRPGAEEAWATALRSADERETVVWSAEMVEAFAIARPVLDAGDEVGARMAFRETYDRLVGAARRAGRQVQWQASLGTDPDRRSLALAAAVRAGRLTGTEHDAPALPAPTIDTLLLAADGLDEEVSEEVAAQAEAARAAACTALRELGARLRAGRAGQQSPDAAAREDTQRRKEDSARLAGAPAVQPDAEAARAHLKHVRDGGRP